MNSLTHISARIVMVIAICAEVAGLCCPEHGCHAPHESSVLKSTDCAELHSHSAAEHSAEEPESGFQDPPLDHVHEAGHCQFRTTGRVHAPSHMFGGMIVSLPQAVSSSAATLFRCVPEVTRPGGGATLALPVRLLVQTFLL